MLQSLNKINKLLIAVFLVSLFLIVFVLAKYSVLNPSANKLSVSTNDMMSLIGESQTGAIIYIASVENPDDHGGGSGMEGSDLIVFDPDTGKRNLIVKNVWSAHFSKAKNLVVTANSDNKIRLYSLEGEKKAEIGKNGSNPIFSHDDKYIVYQKLADEGEGYFELSEKAKGLALYDIENASEKMITTVSGDDWPIGFSADKKFFYFNASRPYENSVLGIINIESGLYSLETDTGKVIRLTNTDEKKALEEGPTMSYISKNAIWTSDRLKVITDVGSRGIYLYTFNLQGGLNNVVRIADGDSPKWVSQDKIYKVRTLINGKESWNVINLK